MSTSRSSSRVSARHQPGRSISYIESALPDGPVDEETVELLNELVHPHHEQDDTLIDDIQDDSEPDLERQQLPWWKRPSPLWFVFLIQLICFSSYFLRERQAVSIYPSQHDARICDACSQN